MIIGTYKECDKMAKQILKERFFQEHPDNYKIYDKTIIVNTSMMSLKEQYELRETAKKYGLYYWVSDSGTNRILFPQSNSIDNISHVTGRIAYIEDIIIEDKEEYIEFKMDSFNSFEYSIHMISEYLERRINVKFEFNLKKETFKITIIKQ